MDFSIVSCTYNPDPSIFPKVLESCLALEYDQELFEILIIDNASDIPVADLEYAKKLKDRKNVRIIREDNQGLTYARMRGFAESNGEFIVFSTSAHNGGSEEIISAISFRFECFLFITPNILTAIPGSVGNLSIPINASSIILTLSIVSFP